MLVSLSLSPVAFAHGLIPQRVAPDVYAFVGKCEAIAPANRGDILNNGFIVGATGIIVIDPGPNYAYAKRMMAAIRKISPKPVKMVIDTHPHPENVLGNDYFRSLGATILAHTQTLQAMRSRCEKCYENMLNELGDKIMAGTEIAYPDMTVEKTSDITIEGRNLSLLYYGWGHSEGDLAVLDRKSGVLFSGGLVSLDCVPVLQQARIKGWINALKQLQQQPMTKLVPGSGPVSNPERTQDTLDYLQDLLDLVERQYEAGLSALDVLKRADLPKYQNWGLYAEQHPLNVQHVYSELEKEEFEK
ncbi:MAG TPA: MBL fold metallo-hydrolase [Burkholderiales bacterium]|nr:MBL fold metallo-hydrolase [Burkholderiales bacterium]